ncbi:MAG: TonB-dependent receptor [Elusimicrobiota bacterium]
MKMLIGTILVVIVATNFSYTQQQLSTLYGRVNDEETGRPLSKINISVANTDYLTNTDKNGEYLLKLPQGDCEIIFNSTNYQKLAKNIKLKRSREKLNVSLTSLIIYKGEEIVVTAEKPAFKKPETSKKTIKHQAIKETSGPKEDVMDVFKTLPGVFTGDDFSSAFSVRGGDPRETGVWLDKVYIVAPYHLDTQGPESGFVSIFSNEMIENATLLSGGFQAEYGYTMSGVVDIESKDAKKRQGKISLSLIDSKIFYELPIGDKSGLLFAARRNYQDWLLKLIVKETENEKFTFPSFYDVHFKFHTQLTPQDKLSLYGINAGTYMYFELKEQEYEKATGDKYEYSMKFSWETRSNVIFGTWEHKFNEQMLSVSSLSFENKYYKDAFEQKSTYSPDNSDFGEDVNFWVYEFRNEFCWKAITDHQIKMGMLYAPFQFDVNAKVPTFVFNGEEMYGEPREYTETQYKEQPYVLQGFIQDNWEILDRLTANFGVRYNYFKLNKNGNISPRVSVAYGITPKTTLRTSWGYYYQDPDTTDFLPEWGGNKNLKSQLCKHYIVGVERELPENFNLKIEGYYKDYDKLISIDALTAKKVNGGDGFSKGVELFLEKKLYRKLYGWLSYTYSESKKKDYKDTKEYWFDYDQRHLISLVANYKFNPRWSTNATWKYGSGRSYTPYIGGTMNAYDEWSPVLGEKNSAHYPAYHRLDLRITKNCIYRTWTLSYYLEMLNLYDRKNVANYYFDGVNGETVTEYQLPFVPLLGMEARF